FAVSTPAIVGICLGASLFLVLTAAVTCVCYRRRSHWSQGHEKLGGLGKPRGSGDKPLAMQQHPRPCPRRPTAVKSPAGGPPQYLKKSPSPTGPGKSPPGATTPSPTKDARTPPGGHHGGGTSPTGIPGPGGATLPVAPAAAAPAEPARLYTESERSAVQPALQSAPPVSKEELDANEKNARRQQQLLTEPGQLGQLTFKLRYRQDKSTLVVTVVKCKNLPAKDPGLGSCDPYVKLQLLPDKQHKVKTRVLRKSRDPQYDEDFTFYGINANQLQSITLHFVVLSFDRYSRDDIIGEVFCTLSSVDLSNKDNHQQMLTKNILPRSLKIRSQGRGEILVSLCWQPAANRLTVVILKARNLPKMDVTGLADPYVKMYLLVGGQRVAKKKTHVKKRTLNPVFNESFVLEVPAGAEGLESVSLEFLLLDWDRVTKNEVIGRLELGGSRCTGSALHHWNEVCNSPRRQIAEWHKLRE
ncbi:synaptotagmin-4, partial [Frankliniella occidentalis]|uniref:Synaptotagmin-4 n=1 Tax=Frankliniella occidentalis TaxID=133901 RepID=A0A9C6U5B3_FRAOC